MEIYQNNCSYNFRTLIYYVKLWYMYYGEKTMVLWKKLCYYAENYVTMPKTMEL